MILPLVLLLAEVAPVAMPSPPLLPPPPADPRIRTLRYSPDSVIDLQVGYGFAAVVELSADERTDSVVVGNTAGWQVTTTKRGDSVVVKPLAGAAATDMVVVTGTRRYVFVLEPGAGGSLFTVRFTYPDAGPAAVAPAVATFRFRGAKELFPAEMHDDGHRTFVSWSAGTLLPAIFAIGRDGREAIVNGRMVDNAYVIEAVAPQFVFRLGNGQAVATRRPVDRR